MSEPAESPSSVDRVPIATAAEELGRRLGLRPETARRLVESGHTTPDEIRSLSDDELRTAGVTTEELPRIRTSAEAISSDPPSNGGSPPAGRGPVDGDAIVGRWMDSVRKTDRPKRRIVSIPAKDSKDVLKKWVDGDDRAMEAWIHSSESDRPLPAPMPGPSAPPTPAPTPTPVAPLPSEPAVAPPIPASVQEREATVVRWLTDLLDRVKSDQFDPTSILQEIQDLQRQLFEERAKRKQLDDQIEHVKRGSIAVIKYVRSREAKAREQAIQAKDAEIADLRLRLLQGGATMGEDGELVEGPRITQPQETAADEAAAREGEKKLREEFAQREQEFADREAELRRRTVQLEGEIRSLRDAAESMTSRESILRERAEMLPAEIQERLTAADQRERELSRRENELRSKFEEIRLSAEELDRKRVPLQFKERELAAWEQQLQTSKQALEIEARRVETVRQTTAPSVASGERERELDSLKNEITRKEEDLRARETLLHQKMMELEKMQGTVAAAEAETMHADVTRTVAETKVPSGVRRLDDLLFGGFPVGAQILVNGPAHTGKDVLARLFAAEGLKVGVPTLWIVTDRTYTQIRDEMTALYPQYAEKESRGMVRYVDLYSRSLGVTQAEPSVRLLSITEKNATDQLTTYVNQFSQDLKDRFGGYRLVFESISTVTAYLDTNTTFRFLQPFVGRRKLDGAASYFLLETGMHTENDLQTLEHMMDGSVNLKVDQLKTFLSVKGVGDAQSRAWIGYTFSKRAFNLGSFSLDHIR